MVLFSYLNAIIIAGLIGLLLFALILRFRRKALGLFLLVAPFNYFYVIVFGWRVSWVESGGVPEGAPVFIKYAKDVFFLMIVLASLIYLFLRRDKWAQSGQWLDWLVTGFLLYQVAMTAPAVFRIGAMPAMIALWQNCGYGVIYFLLRPILSNCDLKTMRRFVTFLLLMGGIVAGIGIAQFFSGINTFQYVSGEYKGLNRAISTLGNPSNLGLYLAFMMIMLLSVGVYSHRFLLTVAFCLMAVCLILTVSMTALFITVVSVVLILALRRKRSMLLFAGVLGTAVFCCIWLSPGIRARLLTAMSGQDEAWILRLENWENLWPSNNYALLFGSGTGTDGSMTVSFYDQGGLADNQYLATLMQYGSLGLSLYLGIILLGSFRGLYMGIPNHRKAFSFGTLRLAGGLVVIGCALAGVTANVMNVFPINLYFWSSLALIASTNTVKVRTSDSESQRISAQIG